MWSSLCIFALLCDELCVRRIVQRDEGGLAQALLAPNDQATVLQFPEDPRGALAAAVELCLRLFQGEVQPDRAVRLDVAVLPGNAGPVQQQGIEDFGVVADVPQRFVLQQKPWKRHIGCRWAIGGKLTECFHERYRFSTHSLLSSALGIWRDAPVTLLREHYRWHPKIINFCNQKFYHGQLIVMTQDHNEPDVLTMYRTTAGNHARGHLNQRQIDVIQQEVLPRLQQENYQSVGIITPYRDQVAAIRKQLGDTYEVDTVHKFQGREQDAIILTSVDNVITDFVDDPHMLNVAVSRAVHSLAVVTSQDPRNDRTNYGDLTRYIEYNNFEVIQSQVYSVFDMLYQGYAEQRRAYLQKHKRVSEYDSENLMYSVIQEVLSEEAFLTIGCAVHVSLATLVKDYEPLTEEERKYARNPLTHVDFLLFNQMDKQPVLAIEVDGTDFHEAGSKQAERDIKKNSILEKCAVPLLRLRTDGSGEKERIRDKLQSSLHKQEL